MVWSYRLYQVLTLGIVVSIPDCHAGDPGSIPGRVQYFFLFYSLNFDLYIRRSMDPISNPELGE